MFARMIKFGERPNVATYNSFMDGYFMVNNVTDINEVFNKMVQSGLGADVVRYSILINGFCTNWTNFI